MSHLSNIAPWVVVAVAFCTSCSRLAHGGNDYSYECYTGPGLVRFARPADGTSWLAVREPRGNNSRTPGAQSAVVIRAAGARVDRIHGNWTVSGDSVRIKEVAVLPSVTYNLIRTGHDLSGEAVLVNDSRSCISG